MYLVDIIRDRVRACLIGVALTLPKVKKTPWSSQGKTWACVVHSPMNIYNSHIIASETERTIGAWRPNSDREIGANNDEQQTKGVVEFRKLEVVNK